MLYKYTYKMDTADRFEGVSKHVVTGMWVRRITAASRGTAAQSVAAV